MADHEVFDHLAKGYPRYLRYPTIESHSSNKPRRTLRKIGKGVNRHIDDEIGLPHHKRRMSSVNAYVYEYPGYPIHRIKFHNAS